MIGESVIQAKRGEEQKPVLFFEMVFFSCKSHKEGTIFAFEMVLQKRRGV